MVVFAVVLVGVLDGPRREQQQRARDHLVPDALDAYLDEHGYTRLGDAIVADHARHVREYADEVAPLVAALGGPTAEPRDFASTALGHVQSIPYQSRAKVSNAYRRPLLVLARNKGDCDSKAVLFLALIHAHQPDLELAVVYVPEHALTGVGLPSVAGDRGFKVDGVDFIYAEPVGPSMTPLGQTAPANKKAGKKGEIRVVP